MFKGILRVKIKVSGHRKKAEIIADKKFTIPKEFILDNNLNDKECDFKLAKNNQVTKIIVDGKEIEKKEKTRPKKKKLDLKRKNNVQIKFILFQMIPV